MLQDQLKGGVYDETLMQIVTIAPGGVVPWHIHPDGHEISYVIDGSLVLDVDGVGKKTIAAGEGASTCSRTCRIGYQRRLGAGACSGGAAQAEGQAGDGAGQALSNR